jgi:hypothetical protein
MRDPYPFQGTWRWVVLPSLLALGGILGGLTAGLVCDQKISSDLGYWLIPGLVKAAVEGGALAVGRRPIVSLMAVFVLGGLSLGVEYSLFAAARLGGGLVDWRIGMILGYGAMPAPMVLVHHLYMRMRHRGVRKALAAGLLYPVAALAGFGMFSYLLFPAAPFTADLAYWAVAEGAFAWMALVVAARLAERKTETA